MNNQFKITLTLVIRYCLAITLFLFIVAILELDRSGGFEFSDVPFLLIFLIYIFLIFLLKTSSKFTYCVAGFFLLLTGYWYIHAEAYITTERFAAYFYLFFLFGLLQTCVETILENRRNNQLSSVSPIQYSKLRYYSMFFYYKFRQFLESYTARGSLLLSEIIHLRNALLGSYTDMPNANSISHITTIFGKYIFFGDLYGYNILSPAFERQDKEFLLNLMRKSALNNNSILFIDVGAYVGDFCVGLPFILKNDNLTIIAFEPDLKYFTLCKENIILNKIKKCTPYNLGLSNKVEKRSIDRFPLETSFNKIIYRFTDLDSIFPVSYYRKFREIYIKIDNEGQEQTALEGAKYLTQSGVKIHLMIEEAVNSSIISYLKTNGWKFSAKITPYNSFWTLH